MEEHIVLCVDVSREMEEGLAGATTIHPTTRIAHTKRLLKAFIQAKGQLTPGMQHRFALVLLKEQAEWLMDFSTDSGLLAAVIDEIVTTGYYPRFKADSLFSVLHQNVQRLGIPKFRVICIYGRSNVLPECPQGVIRQHLNRPQFTLDFIYLHKSKSADNDPQRIYDFWTTLESDLTPGYFFEITKSSRRYTQAIMKLLANPGVRPKQEDCHYAFNTSRLDFDG
ncbi:hypothetical protein IWQ61_006302 [Dispira simplex]|nr:hypothetical protein IWQ61_006302 [Dispira simplex]